MKKKLLISCCLLGVTALTGCGNETSTLKQFNITFLDDANNVLETIKVNEGEIPSYSLGVPGKESTESTNYSFNKWIPEIKPASEDATYRASFTSELNKYTVTFDSDGGTEIPSQVVEWGKTLKPFTAPTKSETSSKIYTFNYWYNVNGSSSVAFNLTTQIKQNYNLKAKWNEETKFYIINFETNGGSKVENMRVNYDVIPSKPVNPTHDDDLSHTYTFDGWYLNSDFSGDEYLFDSVLTGNITLYAKWKQELKKCSVKFFSDGTIFKEVEVSYGGKVTEPVEDPVKEEDDIGVYTFDHWDFDFDNIITGDTTINAVYNSKYFYYHYQKQNSTCQNYGCVEFWETKNGDYLLEAPTSSAGVIEAGVVTTEKISSIIANNQNDERLLPMAHEFDDVSGKCVFDCGTTSITYFAIDPNKLTRNYDLSCPIQYGNMYSYNDYAKNIFNNFSLEGLTKIKFYLKNPDQGNTFILKGDSTNCVGGLYGGEENYDGIIATKDGENWIVTRESGKNFFSIVNGVFVAGESSYTVSNATCLNEVFATFSYAKVMYISDIIVEGTLSVQKEVLNNAIFTGVSNNKTYSLVDTGEKILGNGKKYEYNCVTSTGSGSTFRELFNDVDITGYSALEFYIDIRGGNYLTFVDDEGSDSAQSGAYGLHALDGGHVPGTVKAFNEGNGTWRVTGINLKFRAINGGAKTSEFTYHNRTTLKSLFTIGTANSWQSTKIILSDVVVTK